MPPRHLYLIRHADALPGPSADRRPLSDAGRAQAERLARQLAAEPIDRVLSSPALRCLQTVGPLARARGTGVEPEPWLLEGTDPADTLARLAALDGEGVAACTHGDILPTLLALLQDAGVDFDDEPRWPTACVWRVAGDATRFSRATYLTPP
jgi:8-oxo-dGTP diphosphatase